MAFSFGAWVRIKDLTFPSQKKKKDKKIKGIRMTMISQEIQTPATVDSVLKDHNK